jgi:flagellar basal-body rod modification protein FlgD
MAIAATSNTAASSAAAASTATNKATIAQNFDTFLQLLTTQLKNQNPLSPLDTNQFTQQLVSFAQVEQQINMNSSLSSLLTLQQTSQMNAALGFLGQNVTVKGDTARLTNGQAGWSFETAQPGTAAISVKSATGETAYTGTFAFSAGPQQFKWDGKGNDGIQWADGNYTISIVAKDANNQSVAVSTEVTGVVDAVDVTQNPPVLTIGTQTFTIDQIKEVRRRS